MSPRKSIPFAWKLDALKRFGATVPCAICTEPTKLDDVQYDHALAFVDDGTHESINIRPVCVGCHKKKSAGEHKNNSKAKRLARAAETHEAVVARVMTRGPSRLKGRGFDKTKTRRFDGKTVERRERHL